VYAPSEDSGPDGKSAARTDSRRLSPKQEKG
jgi:hypothetical protein